MVEDLEHRTSNTIRELIEKRRPGWTLERAFYTDPIIFALEMERIFGKYWLYAGHAS